MLTWLARLLPWILTRLLAGLLTRILSGLLARFSRRLTWLLAWFLLTGLALRVVALLLAGLLTWLRILTRFAGLRALARSLAARGFVG